MLLITPTDTLLAIARFVKKTRLVANITLDELAERSGIGTATLSRVEKRGVCSTDNLVRIFGALGVLESLYSILVAEEAGTITELRKLHSAKPRQRARGKG